MSNLDIIERSLDQDSLPAVEGSAPPSGTELPELPGDAIVTGWLLNDTRYCPDIPSLLSELGIRLRAENMPIERTGIFLRTLHPTILASMYFWRADQTKVDIFESGQSITSADAYLKSPIHLVFEGSPGVCRRLADPVYQRDFPILEDFDKEGITDYLIMPLPFSDRARYGVSFATKAACGFDDSHLIRLAELVLA